MTGWWPTGVAFQVCAVYFEVLHNYIPAEHGIGRLKRLEHRRFTSSKKLEINSQIKRIFDPRGILSPYKLIDDQ